MGKGGEGKLEISRESVWVGIWEIFHCLNLGK